MHSFTNIKPKETTVDQTYEEVKLKDTVSSTPSDNFEQSIIDVGITGVDLNIDDSCE